MARIMTRRGGHAHIRTLLSAAMTDEDVMASQSVHSHGELRQWIVSPLAAAIVRDTAARRKATYAVYNAVDTLH